MPILDYAPPSKSPVRDALRRMRSMMVVLAVALLCGAIAWYAQPPRYTASAAVQLVMAWDSGNVTAEEVQTRLRAQIVAMSQTPPPDVDPRWAPQAFRRRLEIKPGPGTGTLLVRFTDTDPARAAATVNDLVRRHSAVPGRPWVEGQFNVGWLANTPAPSQGKRSWLIAFAGFVAALAAGVIGLWFARRRAALIAIASVDVPNFPAS